MYSQYVSLIFLTKLLTIPESQAMRGINRSCQTDSQCRTYNSNLRCYSKPGLGDFVSRRCSCRSQWRYTGRECRPPPGWKAEPEPSSPEVDYVAVLMPTVFLSAATLIITICACYYVHTGNRELHRELKREHKRANQKYEIADTPANTETTTTANTTARENKYRPEEPPPHTPHIEVAVSDSESDEDEGPEIPVEVPEIPNTINLNVIETVKEEADNHSDQNSRVSPAPSSVSSVSGSRLSVRSLEGSRSGLHPLTGLIQPTGLVPGPGYQANMRLLFRQRPASAVSLAAGLTDQHFVLKSRPASAISRISSARPARQARRPASSFSSEPPAEESELDRTETLSSASRPGDRAGAKVEILQEETKSPPEKLNPSPPTNGIIKTVPVVTNGVRKVSDSGSTSSKSSVRFASEISNGKKPLMKKTSSSSISSGRPVCFSE